MRYFLDTEFNGFGGELISLALVPDQGDQEFYVSLELPERVNSWVARNVIPYLRSVPPALDNFNVPRILAAHDLANFLAMGSRPLIVADWPEDIAHFCSLIVTGPGEIITVGSLDFEFLSCPGFSTSRHSDVPHNALHDARALRAFVLESES